MGLTIPDAPVLTWIGPLLVALVGMANLGFQMVLFRRTVRYQAEAARYQLLATYIREVYEVASPGGSPHDVTLSRAAQRALMRLLAAEIRRMGIELPVPGNWPE